MKPLYFLAALLFTATQVCARSTPDFRFGGHTLGETAEMFFAIAKTSASKLMTLDYCKALLDDPSTKETIRASQHSMCERGFSVVRKRDFSVLDVPNCKQVMAAVTGENANVGARLASELGKGGAFFAAGKLVAFGLFPESKYSEVIADMERRFGFQGTKTSHTAFSLAIRKRTDGMAGRRGDGRGIKGPLFRRCNCLCGVFTASVRWVNSRHNRPKTKLFPGPLNPRSTLAEESAGE